MKHISKTALLFGALAMLASTVPAQVIGVKNILATTKKKQETKPKEQAKETKTKEKTDLSKIDPTAKVDPSKIYQKKKDLFKDDFSDIKFEW